MFFAIDLFMRGAILGLLVAAPIGPTGILCVRRTIKNGFIHGFATGMGAAVADALFASVAVFGLASIIELLNEYQTFIFLVGGVAMIIVAAHIYISGAPHRIKNIPENGLISAVVSGFFVTMTNPAGILAVMVIVAGVSRATNFAEATITVAGVFLGASIWWTFLNGFMTLGHKRLPARFTEHVNKATAIAMAAFGVYGLIVAGKNILTQMGWL